MQQIKVSIIQMNIVLEDPEENRKRAKLLIEKAALEKPDVIIMPEMWTTGFNLSKINEICDNEGRPTLDLIKSIAKFNKINIIAGSFANRISGKLYNSSFLINRDGEIAANYDKIHLFKTMDETDYFTSGSKTCIFDIEGIKCGIIICYDLRFPELTRKLAVKGIKVLFVPAQWPSVRIEHWRVLLRARAIENQIFIVACNVAGRDEKDEFNGNSMIISPAGEIIYEFDYKEQYKSFDIDIDMINSMKSKIDYLIDRKPELY